MNYSELFRTTQCIYELYRPDVNVTTLPFPSTDDLQLRHCPVEAGQAGGEATSGELRVFTSQ